MSDASPGRTPPDRSTWNATVPAASEHVQDAPAAPTDHRDQPADAPAPPSATGANEHLVTTRESEHETRESPPEEPDHTPDPGSSRAKVVAVVNQKGGVGKTTTAVSLAAAVAQNGARVLLVDLDPQGNASSGLGRRVAEGEPSTYGILVEDVDPASVTLQTDVPALTLWGGSLDLAGAEIELVAAFNREHQLRLALEEVRDTVDLVIVDCPPSLGLLTINALVAADTVLVPIQCEYYALEGLEQLHRLIRRVQQNLNRTLELGGIVLTMFDRRTNLARDVVAEVAAHYPTVVFDTVIPRTVRLSEAPSYGQPITVFDPECLGSGAYMAFAREFMDRNNLPAKMDMGEESGRRVPTVTGVLAAPVDDDSDALRQAADASRPVLDDDQDVSPWLRVSSASGPGSSKDTP